MAPKDVRSFRANVTFVPTSSLREGEYYGNTLNHPSHVYALKSLHI